MAFPDNWLSTVNNPEGIVAIFEKEVPSLIDVDLHKITLSRNAASVILQFDTLSYPKNPPKKWRDSGFNRVQLMLEFSFIKELKIENWASFCKLDLCITKEENMIRLKSSNGPVRIELLARVIQVMNISAYPYSDDS